MDPETLDVFFTLEQTSVLGTNLITGPYAASKMSRLVVSLRNSQNVTTTKWPISRRITRHWAIRKPSLPRPSLTVRG